jgi:hypothetical protein
MILIATGGLGENGSPCIVLDASRVAVQLRDRSMRNDGRDHPDSRLAVFGENLGDAVPALVIGRPVAGAAPLEINRAKGFVVHGVGHVRPGRQRGRDARRAALLLRVRVVIAARTTGSFLSDLYGKLIADLGLQRALNVPLPAGVTAQLRTDGQTRYVFLMNFNRHEVRVPLDGAYRDMLANTTVSNEVKLERFGLRVLSR